MRIALCLFATLIAGSGFAADAGPAKGRTPVLVELFTSEGCSSCPPADALLSRLQHEQPIADAQIIVLGEHVDYWDGLGWRDRFSSRQYTARQNEYGARFRLDSVYTPQMVVDGATQFVGNDQTLAWQAVTAASRSTKLPLTLSDLRSDGKIVSATVAAKPTGAANGDLFAALVDPMDSTEVRHGENSGRKLQHVAVVRTLARIGSTRDLASGPLHFNLKAPDGADSALMQVVVFAQQPNLGPILGVTMSTAIPGKGAPAQNLLVGQAGLAHLQ
jgi:hypothetical protein